MTDSARRISPRLWIGLGIAAFWLVMTGLLLERELGGTRLEPGTDALVSEPTATWLGVFLGEEQVGYVHLAQAPERRGELDGVRYATSARLTLDLMGRATDLELTGVLWRPLAGPEAEIDAAVRSMGHDFRFRGRVDGGELRGEVTSAGETLPVRLPVQGDLWLGSGFGSSLRFPELEVGDDVRFDSFDPVTLRRAPARVRCVAEEVLEVPAAGGGVESVTAKVLEVETGGLESRAWVDAAGQVLRADTPLGLGLRRLSPAQALAGAAAAQGGEAAGEDLLGFTAVRPTGARPFRGAESLTVRLSGLDRVQPPVDDGPRPRQRLIRPGVYGLEASTAPAVDTSGDAAPGDAAPESDPDPAHLAADAFVQSRHPAIVEQARAVVGDAADSWTRARRLHDWVFERLDKVPVVSLPSALDVLEQRRGDCNEHTVLFTALARAVDVPARIAIGLVWSDELDGFYYHAWPEVHVGGGWIAMDPTLGQPLADATHLKLLEGGIETWPRLLPYLGRLEIDVLEVR